MTTLQILPLFYGENKTLLYNCCDVEIRIPLDVLQKTFECATEDKQLGANSEDFQFFLYNSRLHLMGEAASPTNVLPRRGRKPHRPVLRVKLCTHSVWLPDEYFLLIRNKRQQVVRFPIILDDEAPFRIGSPILCQRLSDEDVLSGILPEEKTVWPAFSARPGTAHLKRWVMERAKKLAFNRLREESGERPLEWCNNLLISAPDADMIGAVPGMLKRLAEMVGNYKTADCSAFYDSANPHPYEALQTFFSDVDDSSSEYSFGSFFPGKQVYAFRQLETLLESGGRTILKKIVETCERGGHTLMLCGTHREVTTLLEQHPSLQSLFPPENRLRIETLSPEEMPETLLSEVRQEHLRLSPEATKTLCLWMQNAMAADGNLFPDKASLRRWVRKHLCAAHVGSGIRRIGEGAAPKDCMLMDEADVRRVMLSAPQQSETEPLEELNRLVGLDKIKEHFRQLILRHRFLEERRRLGLPAEEAVVHHALFTGNPGTGKTTVARLLGQVYRSLGILSKGNVVCVDRAKLVGRYIGETEENMRHLLREARGNVLFVDEAYTLYQPDDSKDFGRRAVECLLDVLTDKNADMVIVFAGYEQEMEQLFSLNPGLRGRFPYHFRFPDYDAVELFLMAKNLLASKSYVLSPDAEHLLEQSICTALQQPSAHYANARWLNQLVDNGIITALAHRVCSAAAPLSAAVCQTVESADVAQAFERFRTPAKRPLHKTVRGFCA